MQLLWYLWQKKHDISDKNPTFCEIFNYQTNENLVSEQKSVKATKHLRWPTACQTISNLILNKETYHLPCRLGCLQSQTKSVGQTFLTNYTITAARSMRVIGFYPHRCPITSKKMPKKRLSWFLMYATLFCHQSGRDPSGKRCNRPEHRTKRFKTVKVTLLDPCGGH